MSSWSRPAMGALLAAALALPGCSDPSTAPSGVSYSVSPPEAIVDAGLPENTGIPAGYGLDVNDAGTVVGGRQEGARETAFIWTRATGERDLGNLGRDLYTAALGINESGQVVGSSTPAGTDRRVAYLRSPAGNFTQLGPSTTYSFANDVNRTGEVAGNITADGRVRAFRWSPAGGMTLLPDLGGDFTQARAINDRGEVAGTSNRGTAGVSEPVVWSATGELRRLPSLGGTYGTAQDINSLGQVAGISSDSLNRFRAALWQPDGTVQDLGTLGGSTSMAMGINDRGEVVGSSTTASGEGHAFFWSKESGMIDLGVLPGKPGSGARRINGRGDVVGVSGGWVTLWRVTRR